MEGCFQTEGKSVDAPFFCHPCSPSPTQNGVPSMQFSALGEETSLILRL